MRSIIRASLKLQFLVIVLAAALVVFALGQLRDMALDVYPEFDPPLVEVQTEALGLSAAEVEALITVPMEADLLNGVAWLKEIHSQSVTGLSSILLIFEPGTDPIRARQMVQERLTQTFALPNVSKPPTMLQPLSSSSRVMMVGLSSEKLSLIEMGVLARWNIKPRLMGVPGVANVAIWGQRERQLQVQVDPKKLSSNGVSLSQIIETTGEALWFSPLPYLESSTPGTAGWIDTPNQRLSIRHELPITSSQDLAKVPVVGRPGLLLGNVAKVIEDHQPLIGDAILDSGTGLILVIEKFPGANTLEVTRGVEEALDAMRPGLSGIEIDTTIFRPANYIELAINNLSKIMTIGLVLIILALIVFYRNFKTALISAITIPLSLIAALLVLYLRKETLNMMVLTGLSAALFVVIDDAIVDVEAVARYISAKRKINGQKNFANTIIEAAGKIRSPIVYATLIIFLAALPVFFIGGLSGLFFSPLIVSYILAILTSFFVALTLTPALTLSLLPRSKAGGKKSHFVTRLEAIYDQVFSLTLKKPRGVIIASLVLVLVAIVSLPFVKVAFVPALKQREFLIVWEAAPGTSRNEMVRITSQVGSELKSIEGVENVGVHVGRAITGDAVVGINSAEIWVNTSANSDFNSTLASVQEVVEGYPGAFREVNSYQPERTAEALFEKDENLVVRVYGYDLSVLRELAHNVKGVLANTEGVVDTFVADFVEEPQVEIEVDLTAAQHNQVKPGDVRRQATTLLSGLQVGNLYQEQKVFDVVVWGEPEIRNSLTDIESLIIETPSGQVPLRELAQVRILPAPLVINREAVSRYIDVEAKVSGHDLTAVTADIEPGLKNIEFPLEYHAEVINSSEKNPSNWLKIIWITIAAFVGIYLLMQAAFSSWRMAAFSYLSLPLALSGGVIATLLSGGILSIGSLIGLLAILSLSVRNTLVLISHFQDLETKGLNFSKALVIRGVKDRFIPIVTTASVSALVGLSLVIAGPIAGNELLYPMAIVVLGGLMTTVFMSLFILPILYLRFGSEEYISRS